MDNWSRYSQDTMLRNQAYLRTTIIESDRYDRLMRSTSTTKDEKTSGTQVTSNSVGPAISLPEVRFSQSLPLPELPQSLPVQPSSPFLHEPAIPRSQTISEFGHISHVYDLPFHTHSYTNQIASAIPQEYEKPNTRNSIRQSWVL